jgi:hypothetical protein
VRISRWLYIIPLRLRSTFRRSRVERELEEEIRNHIEREIERQRAAGLSLDEARLAAMRAFGGADLIKEGSRDAPRRVD